MRFIFLSMLIMQPPTNFQFYDFSYDITWDMLNISFAVTLQLPIYRSHVIMRAYQKSVKKSTLPKKGCCKKSCSSPFLGKLHELEAIAIRHYSFVQKNNVLLYLRTRYSVLSGLSLKSYSGSETLPPSFDSSTSAT